jgi:nitronate monooxygenase
VRGDVRRDTPHARRTLREARVRRPSGRLWCNQWILDQLPLPIVQAPLAGGPSTPELTAAVSEAGGLGFVAAGYKSPEALEREIVRTRALTSRPFGVNVFASGGSPAPVEAVSRFAAELRHEAERAGIALGEPRFDDDHFAAKVELLQRDPVAVVSFTFGCPPRETIETLKRAGSSVWVTVTDVTEGRQAAEAGADALVVQGSEAGGHRGSFVDRTGAEQFGLLALLQLLGDTVEVPLVASGGIATGNAVAAVLAAGAAAAQIGTAFMRTPEAATSPTHRAALASDGETGLTRAFTGRLARGIVNRLQRRYSASAPIAYPELHYLTSPLRAHGRETGDPEIVNLWAGQAHVLAQEIPAGELVLLLADQARGALQAAAERLEAR